MGVADMMQGGIKRADRVVDPGAGAIARLFSAGGDDRFEIRVEANIEGMLTDLLGEALGDVKRIRGMMPRNSGSTQKISGSSADSAIGKSPME